MYKRTLLHSLLFASLMVLPVAGFSDGNHDVLNHHVSPNTPSQESKGNVPLNLHKDFEMQRNLSASGNTLGWYYYGRPYYHNYYNYNRPYYYPYYYYPYRPYYYHRFYRW